MAYIQKYRNRFKSYVRSLIDDTANFLFNEDELDAIIERFTDRIPITTLVYSYNNKFKINCCCNDFIIDITVTDGEDNAVYLIDEWSSVIYFDANDPLNTAIAPTDGDSIEIKYWDVWFPQLMRELFNILSDKTSKLATSQSIGGTQLDTSKLSQTYYESACRWGSRCG